MRKQWIGLALVLLLFAGPAQGYRPETKEKERLEGLVEAYGKIVYAALYSLPETNQAIMRKHSFVENFIGTRWAGVGPAGIVEDLSHRLQREIVYESAEKLASMPADEREKFYVRLEKWLRADRFFKAGLYCGETDNMATLYSLPVTRSLFDPILKNRQWDPEKKVTPAMVSETLATGESGDIAREVRNRLSTLSEREMVEYFRDFLNAVLEEPTCS